MKCMRVLSISRVTLFFEWDMFFDTYFEVAIHAISSGLSHPTRKAHKQALEACYGGTHSWFCPCLLSLREMLDFPALENSRP